MDKQAIQFVDDWTPLREAVEYLSEDSQLIEWDRDDWAYVPTEAIEAIDAVVSLVPRLIKAYEDLWDSSVQLTTAWEAYMRNQTPAGIFVPESKFEL